MVILKGEDYTQARLAGIQHEVFVAKTGRIPPRENVIQYGDGGIITLTEEIEVEGEMVQVTSYGLVLDENSEYYAYLPQVHKDRVVPYESPIAEEEIIEGEIVE